MERFRNRKILIVGVGKTGFALLNFFNNLSCDITVTDIKPIFDLNKSIKKLKKINPVPQMVFGEHRDEDFLDAEIIVYGPSVNPDLPQLRLAKGHGRDVYSELELSLILCQKPVIAVCGSFGRTTVAHMIGYILKLEGLKTFVGGSSDNAFINLYLQKQQDKIDYAIVEISALQMQCLERVSPKMCVFTNIRDKYPEKRFKSYTEFLEQKLKVVKQLSPESSLIVNYDALYGSGLFQDAPCKTHWYSRRSYVKLGVSNKVSGTHFHDRRIQSQIEGNSEFRVRTMKIVGESNRENLLAAISACKALKVSDKSIQSCIEMFPGIPHRLEFVLEKNGVRFYNDSKSEKMHEMGKSIQSFKQEVILIAGGKDTEQVYDGLANVIRENARVLVLVGECKERLNRTIGEATQTYLVGSFEESVLIAYQKSRTGDVIILSPGNSSTDIFRDYEERGNYFKKLVYQL